jgi:hypothetical protein
MPSAPAWLYELPRYTHCDETARKLPDPDPAAVDYDHDEVSPSGHRDGALQSSDYIADAERKYGFAS